MKATRADQPLTIDLRLAALAWLAMAWQGVALYVRPDPFGHPYVGLWPGYLAFTLVDDALAVMIASAPALVPWLACGTHGHTVRRGPPALERSTRGRGSLGCSTRWRIRWNAGTPRRCTRPWAGH